MTILVTGANGQLGNVMRILAAESSDTYIFTDVNQVEGLETIFLDVTDLAAVRHIVSTHKVDAIINCAGYTNVDAAESNVEVAEKLNAEAPENLAISMKEADGLLVHISTDYIFGGDGQDSPYTEEHPGSPTGAYGLSKLHGEEKIIATGCKYLIIRTSWLYSEFGKNFCKTMINLTSTNSSVKVVSDQIGTPTYAHDLGCTIFMMLSNYKPSHSGIYHYSNEGICSWYDFAKAIAELSGSTDCDVQPCTSSEYNSIAKRPSYSALDKSKVKSVFGIRIPHWKDSLERCIWTLKQIH